jgi:uncharacterized SAM-binding protein YcdF (DUF218 family)
VSKKFLNVKKLILLFGFFLYLLSLKASYLLLLQPINTQPHTFASECKAIVVLGGRNDYDRVLKGLEISHLNRNILVVFSGVHPKYKVVVKHFDSPNVEFEDRSTSTYTNAKYTQKILEKKGIDGLCLISSEAHLFRAERVFEKFGLEADTIVSNEVSKKLKYSHFLPDLKYFNLNITLLYEYLAIVYYMYQRWI